MNLRSVLGIAAIAIVALMILGFMSTILNSIIPLTLVAVVAFLLGRMSTRANLIQTGGQLAKRITAQPARQAAEAPAQTAETPRKAAESSPNSRTTTAALPQTRKLAQTDKLEDARNTLSDSDKDFDIKTSEQVLADAKKLEDEIAKRSAAYDPTAALEERKRRLLGDKRDDTSG